MLVATTPAKPNPLSVQTVDDTTLTLALDTNIEDNGSTLTTIKLEMATGLTSTSFSEVSGYSGLASHSFTVGVDGMVLGEIYRFRFKGVNVEGDGLDSDIFNIGFNKVPDAP